MDAWEEYCEGKISVYDLLEAYPTEIKKENIDDAIDEFFYQDIIRSMKELEWGYRKMYVEYHIEITDKNNKSQKLDFILLDDGDDVIETYVLNPLNNQWCNDVKQATSNWSEMDEDLNTLLYVLHQFTYDSEYDIIFDFNYEDEGKEYPFEYTCNNEKYNIVITVDSVED